MSSRAKLGPSVSSNMSAVLVELECGVVVSWLSLQQLWSMLLLLGGWGFYTCCSVLGSGWGLCKDGVSSCHDNCTLWSGLELSCRLEGVVLCSSQPCTYVRSTSQSALPTPDTQNLCSFRWVLSAYTLHAHGCILLIVSLISCRHKHKVAV